MYDLALKNIIPILPILAKTTGGYAAVTDLNGSLLMAVDSDDRAVSSLDEPILELAKDAGRLGYLQVGSSELFNGADVWALPVDNMS